MVKRDQKGFGHLGLLLVAVVIAIVGLAGWKVYQANKPLPKQSASGKVVSYNQTESRALTSGNCSGAGSVNIGPPMPLNEVSFVLPYGEVVGGHVTPIDHQYYNGLLANSALRDTYDVIAPADGNIVSVQHRGDKVNTPPHTVDIPSSDEYRIVIAHTCSFLTYVDLVTSLDANIKSKVPALSGGQGATVKIPVTKGEVIGHIGGQTLDFAVWDLSRPLQGFVDYADYSGESWKPYTAPPTDYMDSSTKAAVVAKYVRTAAPVDGKIDYDIDGKLIGNWFLQGSGGYHAASNTAQNYWVGHLSIAPDNIDPSVYIASIGNYDLYPKPAGYSGGSGGPTSTATNGGSKDAEQFMIKSATSNPATAGQSSGLVKYELTGKTYLLTNGVQWDNASFATGIRASAAGGIQGVILAQLTGARTLKFEAFPGETAAQVSGFDGNAKTYTR